MCAAEVAIQFSALEAVKEISDREQSSLSEAAKIYAEKQSTAESKRD